MFSFKSFHFVSYFHSILILYRYAYFVLLRICTSRVSQANRIMRRSQYVLSFVFGFMMFSTEDTRTTGLLYPRESETREIKSLDGLWNFVKSNQTAPTEGIRDKWYLQDLSKVCVLHCIALL